MLALVVRVGRASRPAAGLRAGSSVGARLNLRQKSGAGGLRADQGVRPTNLCVVLVLLLAACLSAQTPPLDDLKREAVQEVDQLRTLTQQMVDQIFSYSELGFQEYETSRYLTALLEKNGFNVQRGVAGMPTAWVASYGSGKPVIAFMTDIDGIPRASQKPGVAYHDPIVEGAPGHGEGPPSS